MWEVLRAKARDCLQYTQILHMCHKDSTFHEDTYNKYWGGKIGENKLGELHKKMQMKLIKEDEQIVNGDYSCLG